MNLKEYVEKNELATGKGLPQGDTILNVNEVQVQEKEVEGNTRYLLSWGDKEFFVPKGVLVDVKARVAEGKVKVRVTRTGTTKSDTRYTVVGVE